jgi:hypothetical protein
VPVAIAVPLVTAVTLAALAALVAALVAGVSVAMPVPVALPLVAAVAVPVPVAAATTVVAGVTVGVELRLGGRGEPLDRSRRRAGAPVGATDRARWGHRYGDHRHQQPGCADQLAA